MKGKFIDETGNRYKRLTVVSRATNSKSRQAQWLCLCDCGKNVIVLGSNLRKGQSGSCGCLQIDGVSLEYGEAAFNVLFRNYNRRAKKKGLNWNLDKETFRKLTSSSCYWCNIRPIQSGFPSGLNGSYIYNGLDRVDNNEGYTQENVVPCCKRCNRAKDTLSTLEFMEWVNSIQQNSGLVEVFTLGRRAYE